MAASSVGRASAPEAAGSRFPGSSAVKIRVLRFQVKLQPEIVGLFAMGFHFLLNLQPAPSCRSIRSSTSATHSVSCSHFNPAGQLGFLDEAKLFQQEIIVSSREVSSALRRSISNW